MSLPTRLAWCFALWLGPAVFPLPTAGQSPDYPATRRDSTLDGYFGTPVADPYRWLENLTSRETAGWIAAQNALTARYLDGLPQRDAIRARLTELWDYPKVTIPVRWAGRVFYRKNTGLQRQSVLYSRSTLGSPPRELLDPNKLSPDGSIAFADYSVSPDGRFLAYALAEGGSDFRQVHVRDLASGRDLPDTVRWVKFSDIEWTRDGRGFFYSRFPAPKPGEELSGSNRNQRVYYHVVGTEQERDRLIYARPDHPDWFMVPLMSEDGRYLCVYTTKGVSKNRLFYADLESPRKPRIEAPVVPLLEDEESEYIPLGTIGRTLYLLTDYEAPKRRIVAMQLPDTARAHWRTIVPESENVLEDARLVGGQIVVHYLVEVRSQLSIFATSGRYLGRIALPEIGTVGGFDGRIDTPELFYAFTSYLSPTTVYRYDLKTGRSMPFDRPTVAFDPSRYETRQIFYASKDGTRVPMFITGRKDLARDGMNPTLLYGYGGFSASIQPNYSPAVLAWLELGGIYAVPNLRGGGEYGEEWHRAGMLERKQNVFDDFVSAAEYLVRERYTSPAKLAIQGGSNGGLLVGAAMTQRPDLFAVALPAVGVMDMLRYQRFTGGWFWESEYGSSTDSTAFQYLIKYSPLHNLKPGTCYPATLVTTADHDDRVVPSHSYKFTAALQAAQGCSRPALIRIETQGSHGYRPTDKLIAQAADLWAFTAKNLQLSIPATPVQP
jgi:prolyl oligopeptidase